VGWRERLRSGRTLWEELLRHYQAGVDTVRWMQRTWDGLEGLVDAERFRRVQALLRIQEAEARWWRDASVLYWQSFSHLLLPPDYEAPAHTLAWYRQLRCPADLHRPRCDAVMVAPKRPRHSRPLEVVTRLTTHHVRPPGSPASGSSRGVRPATAPGA